MTYQFSRYARLCVTLFGLWASKGLWANGNSHSKNAGDARWENPAGWNTGNIPGPVDTAIINTGTAQISGPQTIGILTLNGGSLTGYDESLDGNPVVADSLTLTDLVGFSTWARGNISAISLIVATGAALDITDTDSNGSSLNGVALSIASQGFVSWQAGNLTASSSSTITNHGVFEDAVIGAHSLDSALGVGLIFNTLGIFHKTGSGTVNWQDGDLDTNAAGSFTNEGILNDLLSHDHEFGETSGSATFTNTGSYLKTGSGDTRMYLDFVQNGTLEVNNGTLILKDAATFGASSSTTITPGAFLVSNNQTTFTTGATISGGGVFSGTGGSLLGTATFATDFELDGATIDGDFNFSHNWTFLSGSIASGHDVDLISTAQGKINTSSTLDLNGSTLAIGSNASLEWFAGNIRTGGDGGINLDGYMFSAFDGTLDQSLAGNGVFDISGEFRKTGGSGSTTFALPVDISGRLEAHSGNITLSAGGSSTAGTFDIFSGATMSFTNGFTFGDGTTFTNGGNLLLSGGTFTLSGTVDLGPEALVTGGTLSGSHSLDGWIEVTGGGFDNSGSTTIEHGAGLAFTVPSINALQRDFTNNGTVGWTAGDMSGSAGTTFTNNGTLLTEHDGTWEPQFEADLNGGSNPHAIINNGTFIKQVGTGTSTINVPFTNNGTVTAQTGTLHFTDTFSFGTGGQLGGGNLIFNSPVNLPSTAVLSGNGTLVGNFTTGGFVSPGNSIGTLNITGDLSLTSTANSFFEVDADSPPGTADLVSVSGSLALGGNLTWNLLSTLDPISTDTFTLYHAANLTGTFLNVANGGRIFTGDLQRSLVVNYGPGSLFDPNSVVLSHFEFTPVPEPSTAALLLLGLALLGSPRRQR